MQPANSKTNQPMKTLSNKRLSAIEESDGEPRNKRAKNEAFDLGEQEHSLSSLISIFKNIEEGLSDETAQEFEQIEYANEVETYNDVAAKQPSDANKVAKDQDNDAAASTATKQKF